jgi:hypothetical protein
MELKKEGQAGSVPNKSKGIAFSSWVVFSVSCIEGLSL